MEFLYYFANASLTQRVLVYLLKKVRSYLDCVTVFFLNDRWILRLKLDASLDAEHCKNCQAFLNENGLPCRSPISITLALKDLDAGYAPTLVMDRHPVIIVSHGAPSPEKIRYFRERFVAGLGYCPQSLV